jgi:hypothetical protein
MSFTLRNYLFYKAHPGKRLSSQTSPPATTMAASKQGRLLVAVACLIPAASSATAVEYCSKIL